MATSRKKASARAKSTAKADAPGTDDLDGLDNADGASSADEQSDGAKDSKGSKGSKDGASSLAAGKDPVKKSRQKGSSAATPSGSEVTQKAKDASRTSSPKKAAAAESARTGRRRVAAVAPNPAWLAPTAVVFLVLGLLYLVTFYLSAGQLPLPIGDWNLAAGFGLMLVGGGMLMFWK
ncbi:cell division protein CrgA [Brachybacterium alimentarium]|uniref:cell division protein CrgA n=1 Tax=Brachybacterium alimentarium TaxID=47845 RepID=UPI000DF20564|nr:cell division protein CrgA [Brachybacterium alimentarium]RCS83769.1 cell division protein CrgA [Brachybacterium alimentarium]